MTTDAVNCIEFHVVEIRGHKQFFHENGVQQACIVADNFWDVALTFSVELYRDGAKFDEGAVTTTHQTRYFTGMTMCVPEVSARWPADMAGAFLTRLCACWFRVAYDRERFFSRRAALEASAFLK